MGGEEGGVDVREGRSVGGEKGERDAKGGEGEV